MGPERKYLFDDPRNVQRALNILYGACALLFALDFVIDRHVYHEWESLWGFYGIYGFLGCVALVLIAKGMRLFIMRPENYYETGGHGTKEEAADDVDD